LRKKQSYAQLAGVDEVRNARINRLRFGDRHPPWSERKQKAADTYRRRYGPR
jgi:hypothetical protein